MVLKLTNEKLKKLFKNNFDLANFAIKIAQEHVGPDQEIPKLNDLMKEILERADHREDD